VQYVDRELRATGYSQSLWGASHAAEFFRRDGLPKRLLGQQAYFNRADSASARRRGRFFPADLRVNPPQDAVQMPLRCAATLAHSRSRTLPTATAHRRDLQQRAQVKARTNGENRQPLFAREDSSAPRWPLTVASAVDSSRRAPAHQSDDAPLLAALQAP